VIQRLGELPKRLAVIKYEQASQRGIATQLKKREPAKKDLVGVDSLGQGE